MTVFRFKVTDQNPAHTRLNLYAGPDEDHLALAGKLTFRSDEFAAFADAITDYNERAEASEDRTEFEVRWHMGADGGDVRPVGRPPRTRP